MNKYNSRLAKIVGWFNKNDKWAITLGQTAYFSVSENEVDIAWHKHEDKHKEQWKREGYIKFSFKYIWYNITKGYWNNPYEVEARAAEKG